MGISSGDCRGWLKRGGFAETLLLPKMSKTRDELEKALKICSGPATNGPNRSVTVAPTTQFRSINA